MNTLVRLVKRVATFRVFEIVIVQCCRYFPSFSLIKRLAPLCIDYRPNSLRQCIREGFKLSLDLSDYQAWLIYYYREEDSSKFVTRYIKPGFICIDIGANIGQTALYMASIVGVSGCVYAFEPSLKTYASLVTNLRLNPQFENIFAYNVALGAENGYAVVDNPSRTNSGSARCIPLHGDTVASNSSGVEMLMLDTFVKDNHVKFVDFVKIDIEGFEIAALQGAVITLARFRPVIVIEVSESLLSRAGYSVQRLQSLVETLGYSLQSVKSGIPFDVQHFSGHEDFVGIPLERVPRQTDSSPSDQSQ